MKKTAERLGWLVGDDLGHKYNANGNRMYEINGHEYMGIIPNGSHVIKNTENNLFEYSYRYITRRFVNNSLRDRIKEQAKQSQLFENTRLLMLLSLGKK